VRVEADRRHDRECVSLHAADVDPAAASGGGQAHRRCATRRAADPALDAK